MWFNYGTTVFQNLSSLDMFFYDIQKVEESDSVAIIESRGRSIAIWLVTPQKGASLQTSDQFPFEISSRHIRSRSSCTCCEKTDTTVYNFGKGRLTEDIPEMIHNDSRFDLPERKQVAYQHYFCNSCIEQFTDAVNEIIDRNTEEILSIKI